MLIRVDVLKRGFAVLPMLLPIVPVRLAQLNPSQDEQVFGIAGFGRVGEIEAAGNHRIAINHDHLVVGNGMFPVEPH